MIDRLTAALRALLRLDRPRTVEERLGRATSVQDVPPAILGRPAGRSIEASDLARIALAGRC